MHDTLDIMLPWHELRMRHNIKYKKYNQLCKSVDRITLLDIFLAKDSVLDVI